MISHPNLETIPNSRPSVLLTNKRQEVVSGNFYRQISVGQIDPNAVSANVENGVLTITIPAAAEPQPVKIAINSTSAQ